MLLVFPQLNGVGLGEINRVAHLPNRGALTWVSSSIQSVGFPPQLPTGLGGFSSTSCLLIIRLFDNDHRFSSSKSYLG